MSQKIPLGARVRSSLPSCRWVGTVIEYDEAKEHPYLVKWDGGGGERCDRDELILLSVPGTLENIAARSAAAARHYGAVAAEARLDAALGEGRR